MSATHNVGRMTEQAHKAVEASLREALQLGHNYINTEHLLLALIRDTDSTAGQILQQLNVTRPAVVTALSKAMPNGKRTCCDTYPDGEHPVQCPLWEPRLTVEEIRHLRDTILQNVQST